MRSAPEHDRAGRRGGFLGLLEQVQDAVELGEVVLKLGRAARQYGQRLEECRDQEQEHHQVPEREVATDDPQPAVNHHPGGRRRQDEAPQDVDGPGPPPRPQLLPEDQVIAAG